MTQLTLFPVETIKPLTIRPAGGRGLTDRFNEFHADNPHVYHNLRRLALAQRQAGIERGSIKQLFEVLRWQVSIQTTGDNFKLNNNYHSFYARLLMDKEPELAGFFETRAGRHHDRVD